MSFNNLKKKNIELKACPLCKHKDLEIFREGKVILHADGRIYNFYCDNYQVVCKACNHRSKKTKDRISAEYSWNNDLLTTEDYEYFITRGQYLNKIWEEYQTAMKKIDKF